MATSPRGRKAATSETISKEEAQRRYVEAIAQGHTVAEAAKIAKRTEKAVEYWRKNDPAFKARADQARELSRVNAEDGASLRDIDFAAFSEKYLGHRRFWHQLQWIDILEGREPRDLHPSQYYLPSRPTRLLINTPPHHAKTQTITIEYVVYRICMDPNVRIKLVSKNERMAKQFMYAVKERLTHPRYTALQAAFGPQGGWRETASTWSATQLYIGGDDRDSGEKDPTLEVLGMGGHIYGARANLIILDDCIVGANAHAWEEQMGWINREVSSRLGRTGKLLVVGTRIAPIDLYRELRNPDHFAGGKSPFTILTQPAVLEYSDTPADWQTLWPMSDSPIEEGSDEEQVGEDGMYPAWDGPALSQVRDSLSPGEWSLVYMQSDVTDDAVFPAQAVKRCVNQRRNMGPMDGRLSGADKAGHRREGMDGLYVVAGLDPAGAGHTAMVVLGVDRATGMRYVLYAINVPRMAPHDMRHTMIDLTDSLSITEWVIEKNAYQSSIARDEEIRIPFQTRGVRLREHFTGSNKYDADFGVASMAPLFGEYDGDRPVLDPKIELASTQNAHAMKSLVEQLVTWQPNAPKTQKTDLVMALWFAELRARELTSLTGSGRSTHMPSKFLSPRRQARQSVVDLRDYLSA